MLISSFIRSFKTELLEDWEAFATTRLPAASTLSRAELLDHASELLDAVADDMDSEQTLPDKRKKGLGELEKSGPALSQVARTHAEARARDGFTLDQMVAEYRALRASVLRRWVERLEPVSKGALDDQIRFSESMDQALKESNERYSAHLQESQSLLLGVLGHDLRTPITAIGISAALMKREPSLSERAKRAVDVVSLSSKRMASLVDDLLDFTTSKLGVGLRMAPQVFDLDQLCESCISVVRAAHPDRVIDYEGKPVHGNWDETRIGQLLTNLLANAVKYSYRDTVISVSVAEQSQSVLLTVKNFGDPISGRRARPRHGPRRTRRLHRHEQPARLPGRGPKRSGHRGAPPGSVHPGAVGSGAVHRHCRFTAHARPMEEALSEGGGLCRCVRARGVACNGCAAA
ncbi:HAMP domain-containing sensor histidine kinase [soil metagenome]